MWHRHSCLCWFSPIFPLAKRSLAYVWVPRVRSLEEPRFTAAKSDALIPCLPERVRASRASKGESKDPEDVGLLNAASGSSHENVRTVLSTS